MGNVTLASHRPRFLKGYKLMKVRSVLKVVAKKFGQYVWRQNDVNALIVNVRYDGKVELLADHMMFKRKRNAFVRTSRKEVNFKSADDAKKNTCLATFVYLMHTPDLLSPKSIPVDVVLVLKKQKLPSHSGTKRSKIKQAKAEENDFCESWTL